MIGGMNMLHFDVFAEYEMVDYCEQVYFPLFLDADFGNDKRNFIFTNSGA